MSEAFENVWRTRPPDPPDRELAEFFWNSCVAAMKAAMPSYQIDDDVGKVWNRCLSTMSERLEELKARMKK